MKPLYLTILIAFALLWCKEKPHRIGVGVKFRETVVDSTVFPSLTEINLYDSIIVDSCINCNFMGLTKEQWKIKDKPFFDSLDNSGDLWWRDEYFGTCHLRSNRTNWNDFDYCQSSIYHPSIDCTIIEEHYYIKKLKP